MSVRVLVKIGLFFLCVFRSLFFWADRKKEEAHRWMNGKQNWETSSVANNGQGDAFVQNEQVLLRR